MIISRTSYHYNKIALQCKSPFPSYSALRGGTYIPQAVSLEQQSRKLNILPRILKRPYGPVLAVLNLGDGHGGRRIIVVVAYPLQFMILKPDSVIGQNNLGAPRKSSLNIQAVQGLFHRRAVI